jgi:heptosyltransferase-2
MPGTVIVRLPNWMGDTVMAVPALRAVRVGLPETRLVLVGPWVSLLAGQGLGDVLVTYPRAWSGRLRQADTVRGLRGDTAVLLPNSLEAALAAGYWGARRRIGYAVGGRRWLLTHALALPEPRRHQVDEYCRLVEPLGASGASGIPSLAPPLPDSPERCAIRDLLAEEGVPPAGTTARRVGIHLGAAFGPAKLWPVERVIELCQLLLGNGDVPVLLGTASDATTAEAIRARVSVPSLVGRDRPTWLPALLVELDALVCGDTGVGHLAAALDTPVVTLFGPTDWRLTSPRGRVQTLHHPTPCAPCFYPTCPIDHPCLRHITADEVRAGLARLTA